MRFWPFGRGPADVDLASRVVTAMAGDHVQVRGKLTLHFVDPVTQSDADDAADQVAKVAELVLREASSAELLGAESHIVAAVAGRLPDGIAATRVIELASLHVVGEPRSG